MTVNSELWLHFLQECQRLESILSLCTEFAQVEREPAGSAVTDLQKINKELEKLQVSDDESVFSDSPSSTAPDSCFGAKARDLLLIEEQQVSPHQQGSYREARSHSPAVSLNSSVPSPSTHHRAKVSSPNSRSLINPLKRQIRRVKSNQIFKEMGKKNSPEPSDTPLMWNAVLQTDDRLFTFVVFPFPHFLFHLTSI